jgi:hypothetical protein
MSQLENDDNYEGQRLSSPYEEPSSGTYTYRDTSAIYALLEHRSNPDEAVTTVVRLACLAIDYGSVQARAHLAVYLGYDINNPAFLHGVLNCTQTMNYNQELQEIRDALRDDSDVYRSNGCQPESMAASALAGYKTVDSFQ